jgi:hypothetical protein
MSGPTPRWFPRLPRLVALGCLLLILAFLWTIPAAAQTSGQAGGKIIISPLSIAQFPSVSFNLELFDSSNRFVSDLKPEEVQILENGETLPLETLERKKPGLQFIAAVNSGPALASSSGGKSLFNRIQDTLLQWAQGQPGVTQDDFSLVTNRGPEAIRLGQPTQWVDAIRAYQPVLAQDSPSSISLSQALDLATDPNPRQNMKRAILYITPPPVATNLEAMPNMTGRAVQLGVRVFVWMVTNGGKVDPSASAALQKLADDSGGEMFVFSGSEAFPDIEGYLEPLRYSYQATYFSKVSASGEQQVSVQVQHQDLQAQSPAVTYQVTISPPTPIFLAPPSLIHRDWLEKARGNALSDLGPTEASIQIVVEFPDQHKRALKSARLYVDGRVVAENTRGPFNQFAWSLKDYTQTKRHTMKVEVEDILGLKGVSIDAPVDVEIAPPRLSFLQRVIKDQRLLFGFGLFVVAAGSIAALIITGRRGGWYSIGRSPRKKLAEKPVPPQAATAQREPISQPRSKTQPITHPWPRAISNIDVPARLVALSETRQPVAASTVLLYEQEVTFGSDADLAQQVILANAVADLHARILQTGDDEFVITDCGSIAGTWVNYQPVLGKGTHLQHGDLVSIGRANYRFELRNPKTILKVTVTPYLEEKP